MARNYIVMFDLWVNLDFVNSVDLLRVPLYADLKVNHFHSYVQIFHCKVNVKFYLLCIHFDIFMHCAAYVSL